MDRAGKLVGAWILSAVRVGRARRRGSQEQVVEKPQRIAQVDDAVIIHVGGLLAVEPRRGAEEEEAESGDGVGDVLRSIPVRVSTNNGKLRTERGPVESLARGPVPRIQSRVLRLSR